MVVKGNVLQWVNFDFRFCDNLQSGLYIIIFIKRIEEAFNFNQVKNSFFLRWTGISCGQQFYFCKIVTITAFLQSYTTHRSNVLTIPLFFLGWTDPPKLQPVPHPLPQEPEPKVPAHPFQNLPKVPSKG